MQITVRPLTDKDELFAVATVMRDLTFKREVLPGVVSDGKIPARLLQMFLCNPRFSMFAAFNEEGAALGYICGTIDEDFYCGEISAYELLWVVGTPFRKTGAGLMLLEAWENFARSKGATRSYMGLNEHTDPHILRHIYSRLNYVPHSASFHKKL